MTGYTAKKPYDLFISYRHSGSNSENSEIVLNFAKELMKKDFSIFIDSSEIKEFDSITQRIDTALSNSKSLLVYLSEDYFESRACCIELTAAFIAAQKDSDQIESRIFIVNTIGTTSILKYLPISLQDAKFASSLEEALCILPNKLKQLKTTFRDLGLVKLPATYGRIITGSDRFAGRIIDMWCFFTLLHNSKKVMVSGYIGQNIAIIRGMGGVGKTLLVEEYILRFGAAYPDGIFWLDAHGSFNLQAPDIEEFQSACKDQFLKILRNYTGKNIDEKTELETLKGILKNQLRGKKCLWVVDDIPIGLSNYTESIKNWFSPLPDIPTIVTTRSKEYECLGSPYFLDVLDTEAALEVLSKHGIDIINHKKDSEILTEKLGCHSLTIDIAGSFIIKNNLTVREYLDEINVDKKELLDVSKEFVATLPGGHERSIIKTMMQSIKKLKKESLDFLRLAAHLSPAPIRDEFIDEIFSAVDKLDHSEGIKRARIGRHGCLQFSLANSKKNLWQIHALISETIKYIGYDSDERGIAIRQTALSLLSILIVPDIDCETTKMIDLELSHAKHMIINPKSDFEWNLVNRIALYDFYRGNYQLSKTSFEKLVYFLKFKYGPNHEYTLYARKSLASTLTALGEYQMAKVILQNIVEIFLNEHGPDHIETLLAKSDLASIDRKIGNIKLAHETFVKVIDHIKEKKGKDAPETLKTMEDYALTLRDMDKNKEAKNILEEVINIRNNVLGVDHPYTLSGMENLASTLMNMRKFKEAKAIQEKVFNLRKKKLGIDHPNTLIAAANYATTLKNIDYYNDAIAIEFELINILKNRFGPYHQDTLITMGNHALTLRNMGKHQEAFNLEEEILEILKTEYGLNHNFTIKFINNLLENLISMKLFNDIRIHLIELGSNLDNAQ